MYWKHLKLTIAALVEKCLAAHGQNCQAWETKINTLVGAPVRLAGFPQQSVKERQCYFV